MIRNKAILYEHGMRPTMEDFYFFDNNFLNRGVYVGVYDGHNGDYAAEYAANYLHVSFKKYLDEGVDVELAFKKAYFDIDGDLADEFSGTVAADIFLDGNLIYHANTGDCRIMVVNEKDFRFLSEMHRLENEHELNRIGRIGTHINMPYLVVEGSGLMPTRTFGDRVFRNYGVIGDPHVGKYEIRKEDLMLLIGTEGLFDVVKNEDIVRIVREFRESELVLAKLKEKVASAGGEDNLTVVGVEL